jgi:hypothetical protein
MTGTMVEIVAEAIRTRMRAGAFDDEDIAVAAITAMRDCTDEMKQAGIAKDDELEWLQQDRAIPQIFAAMIDAAAIGE